MKMKKILSSVIATSMLFSLCAMNTFAATKARTLTMSITDTDGEAVTEVNVGDKIVVTLTSTDALQNTSFLGYTLNYNTTKMSIDTTQYDSSVFKDTNSAEKLEKYVDLEWYDTIIYAPNKANKIDCQEEAWAFEYGEPTYTPTTDTAADPGTINFAWMTSGSFSSSYTNSLVVGKFIFTATESGAANFTLTEANTLDDGENSGAAIVCEGKSVTVKSADVKVTKIEASVAKTSFDLYTDKGEALKTTATATVTPDGATDKTVTWSSDNTNVAEINASTGAITVKAVGEANIKATANDGSDVASKEVKITVTDSTPKYTEGVEFKGTDGEVHTWKATVGSTRTIIKITKKDVGTRNITDFDSFTLEDGAYRVFGIAILTSADKDAFTFVIE